MRRQKQLFRHDPENGVYGDCQRTVFACLLDMKPEDVPHFGRHYMDAEAFWEEAHAFLHSKGYTTLDICFACPLDAIFNYMKVKNPDVYYILAGKSKNDTNHVVIGLADKIVWDPAKDNSGIVAPFEEGHYELTFLIPNHFTSKGELL